MYIEAQQGSDEENGLPVATASAGYWDPSSAVSGGVMLSIMIIGSLALGVLPLVST